MLIIYKANTVTVLLIEDNSICKKQAKENINVLKHVKLS